MSSFTPHSALPPDPRYKPMMRKILLLDYAPRHIVSPYVSRLLDLSEQDGKCLLLPGDHSSLVYSITGYPGIWIRALDKVSEFKAHRLMFHEYHGCLPDPRETPKIYIRHLCHNPLCIERAHLRPGTLAQNNRDKKRRGIIL